MLALTMKKATLDTLIFFIIASQHIFAKVTILRGSSLTRNPETVELICVSEDDGGALVWNPSSTLTHYDEIKKFSFPVANGVDNDNITCKLNREESCLKSWTKDNWNLTNSLKTPMGPVFDQRWEEFQQYQTLRYGFERVDFNLTTEIKLSYSVRISRDAHLLLCNGMDRNKDLCYWIIVGGWGNTLSKIIKCKTGLAYSGPLKADCNTVGATYEHNPLSQSEWRTFVLMWNSVKKTITVYGTDEIILSYTDEEELLQSSKDYYMFINIHTMLRFHIYDFLHTTVESAILTSPIFQFNNDVICVQLLIGLCAECDAYVVLLDVSDNEVLEEVTVKGSSKVAIHGLPMWQSIKIKSNSINYRNSKMKIQLTTKLNDKWSLNPLWAIANVRRCPQNGTLRKGKMLSVQEVDPQTNDYLWPNVTCQKLFYDEHAVASSTSRVKSDPNLDDANCSEGKIGPQCLFSCQRDLHSAYDCMGTKICYVDGCTCVSGFLGDSCSEPCGSNTYGYNCNKTCGSCLYGTSEQQCNKLTGVCSNGCNNTKEMVYVPPLCQTNVNKLDAPTIISTSETTIYAVVPMMWKDEYNEISILYSFAIKEEITYNETQALWNKLFRNMTLLEGYFYNLEPATNYHIRCSLLTEDVQIHSDWQVAVTKSLDEPGNYTFTINNNSVVDLNWLYPWKADYRLKFFRIRIVEIFSYLRESTSRSSINKIIEHPVTYMSNYSQRLYLFPSTVYNISIEAVTVANKSSNPKFVKIYMPSTATFDGTLEAMVDESSSTILLNIPHVLNDTRDSMMHIIVKGANPCEQYSDVPESLRVLADIMMNENAWQAANVSTSEFSGQQFRIGNNTVYGNVTNCPLKSEEFYKIVVIVMDKNSTTKPIMLTSSIRVDVPTRRHYVAWLISITSIFVLTGTAYYLYRRWTRTLPSQVYHDKSLTSINHDKI